MIRSTIAITETMEQVHKHCEKYLALHRDINDEAEILRKAVQERWGDVDPRDVLQQAEINSLAAARMKMIINPKKNPWVTTNAQGDLFNDVPVRVPSVLIINGNPMPYYEASILDGLEWWRARQDAKTEEATRYQEAANQREAEGVEAAAEAEKLEAIIRRCMDNGVDPREVKYAKATG